MQEKSKRKVHTFCHAAFQAWVESIAREDRDKIRLTFEPFIVAVIVAHSLKSSYSPDWLGGRRVDMVNIVEMKKPNFGSAILFAVRVYEQLIHGWLLDSHFRELLRLRRQNVS